MAPQGPECCGLPFSLHSVPPPPDLTPSLVKIDDQYFAGGGFGDVYKCQYLDGLVSREVAVKALRFKSAIDGDTEDSSVKMLRRELGIWRRLHHNNVVPFLGVAYGFGRRNTLSLVSSWMPNGTLDKFIAMHGDKLDVVHRLKILLDVANGLHYLHSLPIVHGDLNTNNVLLDADYTARLADFGYASLVGNIPEVLTYLQRSTMRPGALRWIAPEQIDPERPIARTVKSDIYSFGCIGFQESSRQTNVFSGKQPWSEVREDAFVVVQLYRGDKPGRPESQTMDDVQWYFIQRCWSSLHERPTTDTIILSLRQFLSDRPPSVHLCDLLISSPSQADPETNHELEGVDADSSFQIIPAVASSPLRLTAPTNGLPSILPQPHRNMSVSPGFNQPTVHVALVGATGVGKSTLVNVLKGKEIAEVNDSIRPCTTRAMKYEVVEGDTRYCIWDTRGLNEASEAIPTRALKFFRIIPDADRELENLLRGKNPRFNLVLLCIDAKKIRVNVHWKIYNLIYTDFCERRAKVAVVATQMGERDFNGSGWKSTCKNAAKGVVEEFPDEQLMEAVPKFDELDEPKVTECKRRILALISGACSRGGLRAEGGITRG